MTELPFDFDTLAKDLTAKMKTRGKEKSLREAAEEIGCSAATLSRMLKGNQADTKPDTVTLLRAVSWVGKRLADYEPDNLPKNSTVEDVAMHLRALTGLTETDKEFLVAMVRTAHDQFGSRNKRK